MSSALRVYTSKAEQEDVFLALRELLNQNRCAESFSDETLAELLAAERYVSRRVKAHEVEVAREALILDDAFLV